MPQSKLLSFRSGEIAPSMRYLSSEASYQSGLSVLINGVVRRAGGVSKRAGFRYLADLGPINTADQYPYYSLTSFISSEDRPIIATMASPIQGQTGSPVKLFNIKGEKLATYQWTVSASSLPLKAVQFEDMVFITRGTLGSFAGPNTMFLSNRFNTRGLSNNSAGLPFYPPYREPFTTLVFGKLHGSSLQWNNLASHVLKSSAAGHTVQTLLARIFAGYMTEDDRREFRVVRASKDIPGGQQGTNAQNYFGVMGYYTGDETLTTAYQGLLNIVSTSPCTYIYTITTLDGVEKIVAYSEGYGAPSDQASLKLLPLGYQTNTASTTTSISRIDFANLLEKEDYIEASIYRSYNIPTPNALGLGSMFFLEHIDPLSDEAFEDFAIEADSSRTPSLDFRLYGDGQLVVPAATNNRAFNPSGGTFGRPGSVEDESDDRLTDVVFSNYINPVTRSEVFKRFGSILAMAYHQQRLFVSYIPNNPSELRANTVGASKLDYPLAMGQPSVYRLNEAFSFNIPGKGPIYHMLSLHRLLVFSQEEVWIIMGNQEKGFVTPTEINPLLVSTDAIHPKVAPIRVGTMGYYVNRQQSKLIQINVAVTGNIEVKNIALAGEHFFNTDIVDIAGVKGKEADIIYLLRSDGRLVAITIDDDVAGFSFLTTAGKVKAIATARSEPEILGQYRSLGITRDVNETVGGGVTRGINEVNDEERLYALIERNGRIGLEYLFPREDLASEGFLYADAGVLFGERFLRDGTRYLTRRWEDTPWSATVGVPLVHKAGLSDDNAARRTQPIYNNSDNDNTIGPGLERAEQINLPAAHVPANTRPYRIAMTRENELRNLKHFHSGASRAVLNIVGNQNTLARNTAYEYTVPTGVTPVNVPYTLYGLRPGRLRITSGITPAADEIDIDPYTKPPMRLVRAVGTDGGLVRSFISSSGTDTPIRIAVGESVRIAMLQEVKRNIPSSGNTSPRIFLVAELDANLAAGISRQTSILNGRGTTIFDMAHTFPSTDCIFFYPSNGRDPLEFIVTSMPANRSYVEGYFPLGNNPDGTMFDSSLDPDIINRYLFPTRTISGLYHLAGQRVALFADGQVLSDGYSSDSLTVGLDGTLTVPSNRGNYRGFVGQGSVGLPYEFMAHTLDLEATDARSFTDEKKNITEVEVAVFRTLDLEATAEEPGNPIDNETSLSILARMDAGQSLFSSGQEYEPWVARLNPAINEPEVPFTGHLRMNIPGAWNNRGRVRFRSRKPVPTTILALYPKGIIGGSERGETIESPTPPVR